MKKNNNADTVLLELDKVMKLLRRKSKRGNFTQRGSFRILKEVTKQPGISTKELSEILDIRRASLNERLMKLEEDGLIRKEKSPQDKRVVLVFLGEKGLERLEKIKEVKDENNRAISEILSQSEMDQLTKLCTKLSLGLENYHEHRESIDEVLI